MALPPAENEQIIPIDAKTFYRSVTINEMHDIDAIMAEIQRLQNHADFLAQRLDKAAIAGIPAATEAVLVLESAALSPTLAAKKLAKAK